MFASIRAPGSSIIIARYDPTSSIIESTVPLKIGDSFIANWQRINHQELRIGALLHNLTIKEHNAEQQKSQIMAKMREIEVLQTEIQQRSRREDGGNETVRNVTDHGHWEWRYQVVIGGLFGVIMAMLLLFCCFGRNWKPPTKQRQTTGHQLSTGPMGESVKTPPPPPPPQKKISICKSRAHFMNIICGTNVQEE